MLAPSSARERIAALLGVALVAGACGKPQSKKPEADPQQVTNLANTMLKNVPTPLAVPECKFADLVGGATLTRRTLIRLAQQPMPQMTTAKIERPEVADFVNPPELDSPAALTLVESSDATLKRQAAAELLSAPFYLVYHVDLVDTPIALGIKDFKNGTVGARALRYDKAGSAACVYVFFWSNDPRKQEWAVKQSDKPLIDPAVKQEMQDDLRAQMLKRIAGLAAPPPPRERPIADDRHDSQ
jgi:hypothetical protein